MAGTHFVVARLTWRPVGRTGVYVRLPGDTRVGSYSTADAAFADARVREAEARAKVNPFKCGQTWADRSHMPEMVFRDYVRDAGLEPPDIGWPVWWNNTPLTDDQQARVWEGLTRVRFYRVEERPVRPVAYAVVDIRWQYNDQWYYPGDEGGDPVLVYRTRRRAEVEAARRTAEMRAAWRRDHHFPEAGPFDPSKHEAHEVFEFEMEGRTWPGRDPLDPKPEPPDRSAEWAYTGDQWTVDEVPMCEVVEIELEDGP